MGLAFAALMPNIVRPSTAAHRRAGAILPAGAPGCGSRGTLRQFEAQRTVHRIGFDQPQLEPREFTAALLDGSRARRRSILALWASTECHSAVEAETGGEGVRS